jgi:hypothetical protein
VLELVEEKLLGTGEVQRLQRPAAGVQPHHQRLSRQREVERLLALPDLDAEGVDAFAGGEGGVHGQPEDGRAVALGLDLLDAQPGRLGVLIPGVLGFEVGVAGGVHPLVEEPVQVPAGGPSMARWRSVVTTLVPRCLAV